MNNLLKHALEVYTLTLFSDFDRGLTTTMNSIAKMVTTYQDTMVYEICLDENGKTSTQYAILQQIHSSHALVRTLKKLGCYASITLE